MIFASAPDHTDDTHATTLLYTAKIESYETVKYDSIFSCDKLKTISGNLYLFVPFLYTE